MCVRVRVCSHVAVAMSGFRERERGERKGDVENREKGRSERSTQRGEREEMRMSQSTDEAEGLERREPKCTRLSLAFPAAELHIYTGLPLS